jgi:hypothetical protein
MVTQLQHLLCGGLMGRRTATTQRDAGAIELMADCGRMNAQVRADLPERPTLWVQISCTLNVHRATVTSLSRIGSNDSDKSWL